MDGRTDRQTDGRTEFSSLDRVCISCSAVKTNNEIREKRKITITTQDTVNNAKSTTYSCNEYLFPLYLGFPAQWNGSSDSQCPNSADNNTLHAITLRNKRTKRKYFYILQIQPHSSTTYSHTEYLFLLYLCFPAHWNGSSAICGWKDLWKRWSASCKK